MCGSLREDQGEDTLLATREPWHDTKYLNKSFR